MAFILKHNKD